MRVAPLAALALGLSCGGQTRGTPFDPGWVDNRVAAIIRALAERIAAALAP